MQYLLRDSGHSCVNKLTVILFNFSTRLFMSVELMKIIKYVRHLYLTNSRLFKLVSFTVISFNFNSRLFLPVELMKIKEYLILFTLKPTVILFNFKTLNYFRRYS